MGFLMELPELLEGRVQSKGVEIEVTAMAEGKGLDLLEIVSQVRKRKGTKGYRYQKTAYLSSKDKTRGIGLKAVGVGGNEGKSEKSRSQQAAIY